MIRFVVASRVMATNIGINIDLGAQPTAGVYSSETATIWSALANEAAVARTWGDCYGYLMVATGRAELMVDNLMSPWDSAALIPVVREAGGEFSDWHGRITPFGSGAMASNGVMASSLRARLGVPWPPANLPSDVDEREQA